MSVRLPELSADEFAGRLRAALPFTVDPAVARRLYGHYGELRRWSGSLSLIGPGTRDEVVERHFAESLLALPLIPPRAEVAVDLGSGAGFPGLVLAAARPDLEFWLIEARERKWAFLMAACRRLALPCRCLNARVGRALPPDLPARIGLLTVRAVSQESLHWPAWRRRLTEEGRCLLWTTAEVDPPAGLELLRKVQVPGGGARAILELRPAPGRVLE